MHKKLESLVVVYGVESTQTNEAARLTRTEKIFPHDEVLEIEVIIINW